MVHNQVSLGGRYRGQDEDAATPPAFVDAAGRLTVLHMYGVSVQKCRQN